MNEKGICDSSAHPICVIRILCTHASVGVCRAKEYWQRSG